LPEPTETGPRLSGALTVTLTPGSLLERIYARRTIAETYTCSYGLNPDFQETLTSTGLHIAATDDAGEVRAVELPDRRFFLATLFLPQHSSSEDRPHPLITAYLEAALRFREELRRDT